MADDPVDVAQPSALDLPTALVPAWHSCSDQLRDHRLAAVCLHSPLSAALHDAGGSAPHMLLAPQPG